MDSGLTENLETLDNATTRNDRTMGSGPGTSDATSGKTVVKNQETISMVARAEECRTLD
jgi:hypothetical protein